MKLSFETTQRGTHLGKYKMQIKEITQRLVRSVQPMTPAQARIKALQMGVDRSRQALKSERERQRRQRESERLNKLIRSRMGIR